jgi:Domain of unknown function (DUF4431)
MKPLDRISQVIARSVERNLPLQWWEEVRMRGQINIPVPSPHSFLVVGEKVGVRIAVMVFLVLTLLLLPQAGAQQEDWLSYYPAVARLQGKLTKVSKYGKPTYGENPEKDEKVEVPILILQTPVRVRARLTSSVNNESVTNISFVQLIFPREIDGNYAKYLDKDIVVAGTLVRGHKGDHFTDVVMTVKVVNPTGKPM